MLVGVEVSVWVYLGMERVNVCNSACSSSQVLGSGTMNTF